MTSKRIVHDADCLDIARVLRHRDEFRRAELCFYGLGGLDPVVRECLVEEAADIVAVTEHPMLKLYMEQVSARAYEDFIAVVWRITSRHGRWPLLGSFGVTSLLMPPNSKAALLITSREGQGQPSTMVPRHRRSPRLNRAAGSSRSACPKP